MKQMEDDFLVLNIREYIKMGKAGEDMLRQVFSSFKCEKNLDVESFLTEQSIDFTKKNQSVTYIVISPDNLLSIALGKVKELQYMAGGMVVFLESENKDRLLDFYEKQNGFKRFDTKVTKKYKENSHTLVQLLKVI